MRVSRLAVAIGAATIFAVPLVGAATPASADTPGCVSASEFQRVHNGKSRGAVHNLFDTNGRNLFENPGVVHNSAREYRMCAAFRAATGDTKVQIQYNNYAAHGGPQRVVFKQHY